MRRRFKTAQAFEQAAQRRGFELDTPPKPELEAKPEPAPAPTPAPAPAPAPQDNTAVTEILQALRDNVQRTETSQSTRDQQFAQVMQTVLEQASAGQQRPLRWKVTVTGRDYDGRITELDIQAHDTSRTRH